MASKVLTAREKVWSDGNGSLVKDGHEGARSLVAMPGQRVPHSQLESFGNISHFFDGLEVKVPEEKAAEPKGGKKAK